MTKKFSCVVSLLLLVVISLSSCQFFKASYTLNSISDVSAVAVVENYGVRFPEDAIFVEGLMYVGIRDPFLRLTVRLPQNEIESIIDESWPPIRTSTDEDEPLPMQLQRIGDGKSALLQVSDPAEDGTVMVTFYGYDPSEKWLD